MEQLPSLVLFEIFKLINLKERLKLGLVCKNWRQVVLNLNQESLFCYFDVYPRCLKWSHTNTIIGFENSIQIKSLNFLNHEITRNYFQCIKKLIIFNLDFGRPGVQNFEKYIEHFQNLEQLELNGFNLRNESSFEFPNLKILTLKDVSINNSNYVIKLRTPYLEYFICWKQIRNVKFLDEPDNLKYLECVNDIHNFKFDFEFKKLEQLNLFDVTGFIRDDFLKSFPKLKKLNLYSNFNQTDLERFKRTKELYGLDDLKILFLGFEDDVYVKPTIGYNFTHMLQRRNIESLIVNYSKLNQIVPWPVYLDFCELFEQFNQIIPNGFLKKFVNINTVHVSKLADYRPLIEFLNHCGNVQHLRVSYSFLPQQFYDLLPFLSISILEITEENTGNIQNFNFISKLKTFQLKIRFNSLPVQLIQNRLNNLELKYFNFKKESFSFSISSKENAFYVKLDQKTEIKFTKPEELLNCIRKDKRIKNLLSDL